MAKINDLSQGNLGKVWDAIRKLQYATNQNAMAIGRGGLTVYGGGGITIENGGLYVTGSASITGLLEVAGTINMTGTFTATGDVNLNGPVDIAGNTNITGDVTSAGHFTQTGPTDLNGVTTIAGDTTVTGDFTVTGPTDLNGTTTIAGDTTVTGDFDVNGPMKTTGTLSVEGVTTLRNDLNVTTGGKITAGNVSIDPSLHSGAVKFSSGRVLYDTGSSLIMANGTGSASVSVTSSQVVIEGGTADIHILNNLVGINADLEVTGNTTLNLTTTGSAANVFYDSSSGRLYYKP
ncbi:hypothetical protein FQP90_13585 [Paenarthrobacter nitroguajacolicus]|uniref:Polymer-forming cytoskeletal protein n=1 Tax=Paenarthrobacter nitroguajacolicus TaxID=211146 RepID=A0A558GXG5_PAENT|nr:hypothetical protein [Paenarthrobacter nitroguajacolicus]TVU61567.1 hypothetical protein FQP90_13585 [Paenarthrobacter nitroguajacolicus]